MGLNVQLITESGEVIGVEVLDDRNILARLIEAAPQRESSHCIQYLDLYGDTTFNRLQVDRFLDEWKLLEAQNLDAEQKELVEAVRQLALSCRREVHHYLKFIGD